MSLYWDIGRLIVERQQDAKHGAAIAERLADDLRDAFADVGGFSRRNVFYMREFYLLYRDEAPKKVKEDYDTALAQLKDLAAGRITLQAAGVEAPAPVEGAAVLFDAPPRIMTGHGLKGF